MIPIRGVTPTEPRWILSRVLLRLLPRLPEWFAARFAERFCRDGGGINLSGLRNILFSDLRVGDCGAAAAAVGGAAAYPTCIIYTPTPHREAVTPRLETPRLAS
jgi:hypothetical protein